MRLAYPIITILILVSSIIVIGIFKLITHKAKKPILVSIQKNLIKTNSIKLRKYLLKTVYFFDRTLLILIILTGAILSGRPQEKKVYKEEKFGLDVIILLDASRSMTFTMDGQDLYLEELLDKGTINENSRLALVSKVIEKYAENDTENRIGLVAFYGSILTLSPLTFDHSILSYYLDQINPFMFPYRDDEMGTSIGNALLSVKNKFQKDTERTKIVLLMTDGESNYGSDPIESAKYLNENNIKIYPIIVSSENIDGSFDLMKEIAQISNTEFYQADSPDFLDKILNEIDSFEKTKIESKTIEIFKDIPNFLIYIYIFIILIYIFIKQLILKK